MNNLNRLIKYFDRNGMLDKDVLTIKIGAYFEPYGAASENWEMVYNIYVNTLDYNFHVRSKRWESLDSVAKRTIDLVEKQEGKKVPHYEFTDRF